MCNKCVKQCWQEMWLMFNVEADDMLITLSRLSRRNEPWIKEGEPMSSKSQVNDWKIFLIYKKFLNISLCPPTMISRCSSNSLEQQYFIITLSHFLINRSHYLRHNLVLSLIDKFFLSFMAEWIWHHCISRVSCWYWSM